MDELYESEVMWPDHHHAVSVSAVSTTRFISPGKPNNTVSSPVTIPAARRPTMLRPNPHRESVIDESEIVPLHVMVSARSGSVRKVAFSVCSGQGRTLKGRDLSHVRDSVLRMTGYLEP